MATRAVVVTLAVLVLAPPAAHGALWGDPAVAGAQVALHARGLYAGPLDGLAGPATAKAVRTLQRAHGLAPTGKLDRRTVRALGRLGRPRYRSRVLRRGLVGLDVSALQFDLARHGF